MVIDANVFVSAAIGRGASTQLVDRWLSGGAPFELIICPWLLGEVAEVLDRPRLRKRISETDANEFVAAIRVLASVVPDPRVVVSTTRDAGDDYLVALAREHDAAWIVTGDEDLLEWVEQRPPAIAPARFEEWLDGR